MSIEGEKSLLQHVDLMLKHNKELEELKGETFNIFSILGMESKENATHSAFISELLNPRGSHFQDDLFLKLFLEEIGNVEFETSNAQVIVEKHIGTVDFGNAAGGRIDIYLQDRYGRSLCIENKIYAGDQPKQIERYFNHNTAQSKVYYLTLSGGKPSKNSCGSLEAGVHYHCISYKHHIINWLQKCMQVATENAILREAIRQYLILIKKLTGGLSDKKMEKELIDLLLNNLAAAEAISKNLDSALYQVKDKFRKEVVEMLAERLNDNFEITVGSDVSANYAQIWVRPRLDNPADLKYGIEAFSGKGHFDGALFFGIHSAKVNKEQLPFLLQKENTFGTWLQYRLYEPFENKVLNLRHKFILSELYKNESFRNRLKFYIIDTFVLYVDSTKDGMFSFINQDTVRLANAAQL